MNLQPVRFEDESSIQYQLYLDTTGKNRFWCTLIAKFTGAYADGGSGRADAAYILGVVSTAMEIWNSASLVLDLSGLKYEWGDEMRWLLPPNVHGRPAAVVVGPGCTPAVATLLFGLNTSRSATEAECVFADLDEAIAYVRRDCGRRSRPDNSEPGSNIAKILNAIADKATDAINYCASHTASSFRNDELTQKAVAWAIEVVGAASADLPDNFRRRARTVDWHELIRLRHHILEYYNEADPDLLYSFVTDTFPAVVDAVRSMQAQLTAEAP